MAVTPGDVAAFWRVWNFSHSLTALGLSKQANEAKYQVLIIPIPVIRSFPAQNALFQLGINLTTGQKQRNRVKRTETGRHASTHHLRCGDPQIDCRPAIRATRGLAKEPFSSVHFLIYFPPEKGIPPSSLQVPLPSAEVYPAPSRSLMAFLVSKSAKYCEILSPTWTQDRKAEYRVQKTTSLTPRVLARGSQSKIIWKYN